MIGVAVEVEPGVTGLAGAQLGHAPQMAKRVLRQGTRVAHDVDEAGTTGKAEQRPQLAVGQLGQFGVGQVERRTVARAAHAHREEVVSLRCAAGEELRGKDPAQRAQRLRRRDEEAVGGNWARQSARRIPQVHERDRYVGDRRQRLAQRRVERGHEPGRHVRRERQRQRAGFDGLRPAGFLAGQAIAAAGLLDALDPTAQVQRLTQAPGQRRGQLVQATMERGEPGRGLLPGLGEFGAHGEEEAAAISLHGRHQGEGRGQADRLGIAGVEAGDQRLEQSLATQAAQPAPAKGRHGFVLAGGRGPPR